MYGIKVKDTGSASYIIVPTHGDANEAVNKVFSIVKLAMAAAGRTCYDWDTDENGVMAVNFYDDSANKAAKMELSIVKF